MPAVAISASGETLLSDCPAPCGGCGDRSGADDNLLSCDMTTTRPIDYVLCRHSSLIG